MEYVVCLWGVSQSAALHSREKMKVNLDFFLPFKRRDPHFLFGYLDFWMEKVFSNGNFYG